MKAVFLRAEWRKLILINYVIEPSILRSYLPYGTELDLWKGNCYVSLVGFMFENTRVKGLSIPFHTSFEEVNLRFYVRYKDAGNWRRGVVFVREIVSKPMISWVANTLYKEHYRSCKMKHEWTMKKDEITVSYAWKWKGNWQQMEVKAEPDLVPMVKGSEEDFISEHYWGYTKLSSNKTAEYGVEHPSWDFYPVKGYQIEVDFGEVYGAEFGDLGQMSPHSVQLAEGSPILVRHGRKIKA